MTRGARFRRWLGDGGGALVLCALVAYIALAPTVVVDGDNAEMATLGAIGGRAHPSGYPAYILYLRATSWIPGASPAHGSAIATALLAVALVAALHAACRAWGGGRLGSALATAMYAASPIVLRQHLEAEVFAMNGLVVALVLLVAADRGPLRGAWRGLALGLVAGIGLGDHLTCALVAPVGLLGVIRAVRERRSILPAALAIAGTALGLASYAYLVVADGPQSHGRADSFADVLAFFTRQEYGGAGTFASNAHPLEVADNLLALAASIARAYLYLPALAALGGLGVFAVRGNLRGARAPEAARTYSGGETAWAWRALLASFVLAGPILASRFNIAPTGLGLYVDQRFHLLPILLLAPALAAAIDAAMPRAASVSAAVVTGVVAFVALVAIDLPRLRAQHSPAMQIGVDNLLRSLPPRAVVTFESDDICMVAPYLQAALHVREDVDVVCWDLTRFPWYRARFAGRVPFEARFTAQPSIAWADRILADGRPLFTDRHPVDILTHRPSYPYGVVVKIEPASGALPTPAQLVDINRGVFARFDLDYPRPGPDDDWATIAQRRYVTAWTIISNWLEQNGDRDAARDVRTYAASLAPSAD